MYFIFFFSLIILNFCNEQLLNSAVVMNGQNKMNIDVDVNSNHEAYTSSDFTTDETAELKFRNDIKELVEKALNSKQIHDCKVDWNSLRFLGSFLGIDDFEFNLFSSWVLRSLADQIIVFFNDINECNYKNFICWLYQGIHIVCNNPDVSRKQFFEFMETMFHEALTEILNGKGLLPLSNFIHQNTTIGNTKIKLGNLDLNTGCGWVNSSSDIEEEADYTEAPCKSFDSNFKHDEDSLHAIVEATYRMFGDETNYELIKSAFESRNQTLRYKLPYHCRKPRIVRGSMPSEEPSITLNTKIDKSKKKRKSLKKESLEMPQDIMLSIDSATVLDKMSTCKPEFILPLAETLEAEFAINNDDNEEIETDI